VLLHRGRPPGAAPSYLPNYREFYEKRQFAGCAGAVGSLRLCGQEPPFSTRLLFRAGNVPGLAARRGL
jgi:NAD+ synthase (glutamine-hydrolysing)